MTRTILVPFRYDVEGVRVRSRSSDIYPIFDTISVDVREITESEVEARLSYRQGYQNPETLAVVDGRIYTQINWGGSDKGVSPKALDDSTVALLTDGFRNDALYAFERDPFFTPHRIATFKKSKQACLKPNDIRHIEVSDEDPRREVAEAVGRALVIIDGKVYSNRWEPILERDADRDHWHLVEALDITGGHAHAPYEGLALDNVLSGAYRREEQDEGKSLNSTLVGDLATVRWAMDHRLFNYLRAARNSFHLWKTDVRNEPPLRHSGIDRMRWAETAALGLVAHDVSSAYAGDPSFSVDVAFQNLGRLASACVSNKSSSIKTIEEACEFDRDVASRPPLPNGYDLSAFSGLNF